MSPESPEPLSSNSSTTKSNGSPEESTDHRGRNHVRTPSRRKLDSVNDTACVFADPESDMPEPVGQVKALPSAGVPDSPGILISSPGNTIRVVRSVSKAYLRRNLERPPRLVITPSPPGPGVSKTRTISSASNNEVSMIGDTPQDVEIPSKEIATSSYLGGSDNLQACPDKPSHLCAGGEFVNRSVRPQKRDPEELPNDSASFGIASHQVVTPLAVQKSEESEKLDSESPRSVGAARAPNDISIWFLIDSLQTDLLTDLYPIPLLPSQLESLPGQGSTTISGDVYHSTVPEVDAKEDEQTSMSKIDARLGSSRLQDYAVAMNIKAEELLSAFPANSLDEILGTLDGIAELSREVWVCHEEVESKSAIWQICRETFETEDDSGPVYKDYESFWSEHDDQVAQEWASNLKARSSQHTDSPQLEEGAWNAARLPCLAMKDPQRSILKTVCKVRTPQSSCSSTWQHSDDTMDATAPELLRASCEHLEFADTFCLPGVSRQDEGNRMTRPLPLPPRSASGIISELRATSAFQADKMIPVAALNPVRPVTPHTSSYKRLVSALQDTSYLVFDECSELRDVLGICGSVQNERPDPRRSSSFRRMPPSSSDTRELFPDVFTLLATGEEFRTTSFGSEETCIVLSSSEQSMPVPNQRNDDIPKFDLTAMKDAAVTQDLLAAEMSDAIIAVCEDTVDQELDPKVEELQHDLPIDEGLPKYTYPSLSQGGCRPDVAHHAFPGLHKYMRAIEGSVAGSAKHTVGESLFEPNCVTISNRDVTVEADAQGIDAQQPDSTRAFKVPLSPRAPTTETSISAIPFIIGKSSTTSRASSSAASGIRKRLNMTSPFSTPITKLKAYSEETSSCTSTDDLIRKTATKSKSRWFASLRSPTRKRSQANLRDSSTCLFSAAPDTDEAAHPVRTPIQASLRDASTSWFATLTRRTGKKTRQSDDSLLHLTERWQTETASPNMDIERDESFNRRWFDRLERTHKKM